MGRAPCCDKANVKKGPWSPDEDAKLKAFIDQNGTGGNWITLPSKAGLKRCGKSCRLRWINYLRPDIKHGSFTEEEERMIFKLHSSIGSRWSLIAAQLPGRTDNDIKNYWNTRLKKKLSERKLDHQSSSVSTTKFQRPSPPHDRYDSDKMDDAMLTTTTVPPSCQQATGTLNSLSPAVRDSLISQFLKPQHQQFPTFAEIHEASLVREASSTTAAAPLMKSIQQQVGAVKSEVQVVPAAVAGDGGGSGEVNEQLLLIESSLRSCISSHPSPASSCSGISTDRSTYAPAQCAESSYNTPECLSSVYQEQQQQQQNSNNNNGIEDSDALLPVMSSAASPTLLVHSSVQSEERGALEFGSRLADVGGLVVDEMTPLFVQEEESSHQSSKSFLLGGVKAEEFSFDRFDCNWWSSLMANPSQKQIPTQRTLITAAAAPQKQQQQQQQQQMQQQQQFMQLQQQNHNRYGESLIPTQLSLDNSMPCYMKPPSWNPTPSSCNGNVSMSGSIADYGIYHHQTRHGSWDSVNWAETR